MFILLIKTIHGHDGHIKYLCRDINYFVSYSMQPFGRRVRVLRDLIYSGLSFLCDKIFSLVMRGDTIACLSHAVLEKK